MDRTSWLWRRKSSEKSPGGETESSGTPLERLSDDQTLSNIVTQSPEATSNAASGDGHELSITAETLSQRLSDALANIRAKEDLVRKHAKVAEEAVSGWEKAENEVIVLKKQNDTLIQNNSFLEERVGHLDGALKECLRQLRRAREEQEERIHEAIVKKANEWESKKAEFENQLEGLHIQLQNAKTEADDALSRLKAAEDKNSALMAELLSKTEELELRTWSNERSLRIPIGPPVGIHLMDDFLEMERLAALPEATSQDEVKAMINRGTELEEHLKKIEEEKGNLEVTLNESRTQLKQTEAKLVELKTQLALANESKRHAQEETELMKMELQSSKNHLAEEKNAKIKLEEELVDARMEREEAELKIKVMDCELETLRSSISVFEKELENERKFSREASAKGNQLESEISRMKLDSYSRSAGVDDFKNQQDQELAATASKFAQCQQTIASLSRQLKSLATFEDFLIDPDRSVSVL